MSDYLPPWHAAMLRAWDDVRSMQMRRQRASGSSVRAAAHFFARRDRHRRLTLRRWLQCRHAARAEEDER